MGMNGINERFAVSNRAYYRFTLDYFLDSIHELGVRHIDLWGLLPHLYAETLTPCEAAALARKVSDKGMDIIGFTPEAEGYPFNIASQDDALRRQSIDYFKRSIGVCRELGAPLLAVNPGWAFCDEPKDGAAARSISALREILFCAQKNGVEAAVLHGGSNLMRSRKELQTLLDSVDEAVFIAVEAGFVQRAGERITDYFETFGDRIRNIYFANGADGSLSADEARDVCASAVDAGYSGWFTVGQKDRRNVADPHGAIKRALQALKQGTAY